MDNLKIIKIIDESINNVSKNIEAYRAEGDECERAITRLSHVQAAIMSLKIKFRKEMESEKDWLKNNDHSINEEILE